MRPRAGLVRLDNERGLVVAAAAVAGESATPTIVAASRAFTATLDKTKLATLQQAYPAKGTIATTADFSGRVGEQCGTSVWSNYPISDVIRKGLRLGDLSTAQRSAAMAVLQAALSDDGYNKVRNIVDADQILSDSGTNYVCGADSYVITFVGTPSETDRWMLQYGGHHLGLQAVLSPGVTDLVLGPGKDGQKLAPAGVPASAMTTEQRTLLVKLMSAWVNILNEPAAASQLATISAALSSTYFAWSGGVDESSTVYFRVTGPTAIIEYADQGSANGGPGGNGTGVQAGGVNDIHTVYRSVSNNYGRAFT